MENADGERKTEDGEVQHADFVFPFCFGSLGEDSMTLEQIKTFIDGVRNHP